MTSQKRQSESEIEAGDTPAQARLSSEKNDWERSTESLRLLALVVAVATGFLLGFGVSFQSVWTGVLVRMQAALVQAHVS